MGPLGTQGHQGAPWAQMGPWVPGTQGPWEGPGDPIGDPGTRGSPPKPVLAHPKDPWDPWGHPGILGEPRGPSGDPGASWGNPGTLGPKTHVIWDLGPNGPNGTQGPRGTPGALYLRVNLLLRLVGPGKTHWLKLSDSLSLSPS